MCGWSADTPFSQSHNGCVGKSTECGVVELLQLRMMSEHIDAKPSCTLVKKTPLLVIE